MEQARSDLIYHVYMLIIDGGLILFEFGMVLVRLIRILTCRCNSLRFVSFQAIIMKEAVQYSSVDQCRVFAVNANSHPLDS